MSSVNETNRQFSLRHIKHETKLNNSFYSMLKDQNLVDVIVSCEGNNIRAHRLVLSANSSYFKSLFDSISSPCQIPVIVLKDVPLIDLKAIIEFMYRGEVLVQEKQLSSVLKSAELLKVFGLTEVCLALRSRLTNEGSIVDKSTSSPTAQKRPRISDGPKQTTQQQSNDILFSRLSNARFEIRPATNPSQSPQNLQSNEQQLRIITSSLITSKPSTVVKNVILPTSQIYTKSQSTNAQIISPNETINIALQPKTVSNVRENSKAIDSTTTTISTLNSRPITSSVPKQTSVGLQNVQTTSPKRISSSTWTPSQHSESHSLLQSPSTSRDQRTIPPIEVIIDEETHDMSELIDEDIDIKPPIFELNESIRKMKELTNPEMIRETSKRASETSVSVSGLKSRDPVLEESRTRSRSSSIKSRTSSTSSQSLPPPPSYRVVQRSSSRLLRNIIRPPPSLSPSTSKAKESEDKPKFKKVKKERQLVVKFIKNKSFIDPNSSSGDSPEIECPSCGQKFNDEKNWNEHIANVHLPSKT